MSRTTSRVLLLVVAVLALLVAGATVSADTSQQAQTGNQSQVVPVANTSNTLSLDGPVRQTYVRADVDVAGATAVSTEHLHGSHVSRTFELRYGAATDGDDIEAVRATVEVAERQLDRLNSRQAQLYRAYANRSIDRDTLVRRLALLDVGASQVSELQDDIRTTVDDDLGTSLPVGLDSRVSALEADIVGLPTPVSSAFVTAVTAETQPVRAYASGTDAGLVLTILDGDTYVRQATARAAYAPDQPNQFERAITEAYQRALDLYPWVADSALNGPNLVEQGMGVYRVNADHPHGELTTYIHGATGAVFHEIQRKDPGSIPVTETLTNATGALNLTVQQSTATGPMRVLVSTPDGSPARATVSVDQQVVGTTGGDGELWVAQPRGNFQLNATTAAGDSVTLGTS